jgi:superfamily II DNA helicase RecQ
MMMFAPVGKTLLERRSARRNSLEDRVARAAEIANAAEDQVLVWCDLNKESEELTKAIRGAVEVEGSMSLEEKEKGITGFLRGERRVLVSKPSIAGFGINAQNAHIEIFVGLSDSFEAYYQAVRRCWRFGQDKPVDVYIIISDAEGAVKENIQRKQRDAERMTDELIAFTKEFLQSDMKQTKRDVDEYYAFEEMEVQGWMKSFTA